MSLSHKPRKTACNPEKVLAMQNRTQYKAARGVEKDANVAYNFIPVDREQSFLMPPSLRDWLPDDHLA